jgi:hypothetical protein
MYLLFTLPKSGHFASKNKRLYSVHSHLPLMTPLIASNLPAELHWKTRAFIWPGEQRTIVSVKQ